MTFVLQSKHVAPTGTKILPVALTKSQLKVTQARAAEAKKQ
jgi:cell division protein FtsI (penicillin-binding protein 3)